MSERRKCVVHPLSLIRLILVCRLHVAFHGCRQFAESVGTVFVEHSGLNAWAESNNIIVLYPQTVNSDVLPFNPKACWDWCALFVAVRDVYTPGGATSDLTTLCKVDYR